MDAEWYVGRPDREGHRPPVSRGDYAALGGLALLTVALLAPLRHYVGPIEQVDRAKAEHDSFPLSTYPMFSEDRRGRITVAHVVGWSSAGRRIFPAYEHYGAGGLNQVRRQVARDVRAGRALHVAQRYADSLADDRHRRLHGPHGASRDAGRARREAEIVKVTVVRSRFRFDDYFTGARQPQAEVVFAECAVGGTAVAHPGGALPRNGRGI